MDPVLTEEQEKVAFAAFLFRTPTEPFVAALAAFGGDTSKALLRAMKWPSDPVVIKEMARLKSSIDEFEGLPSKADLLRQLWRETETGFKDERIKALKLYAEVRGFMPDKSAPIVQVNNNRVMVIKDKGTDTEWENGVQRQQANLLNESNTRH